MPAATQNIASSAIMLYDKQVTGFLHQTLAQLFESAAVPTPSHVPGMTINGITPDSRTVQPGYLYVAIQGTQADGHRFIPQAIERGAAAILGDREYLICSVPYIKVEEPRVAMALLSAAFYGFPGRRLTVIGVTGTDGKTTTANLIYQILLQAGCRSGIISTVNATIGQEVLDTGFHVTTPEAPEVQRFLARMVAAGLTHVVLEATSHGLSQHRVTACEFDVAVVTNITHEHLDYHGSFDAYRAAKAGLFTGLSSTHAKTQGNPRAAVLNQDDSSFNYLASICPGKKIPYYLKAEDSQEPVDSDLYASAIRQSPSGLFFEVKGPGFNFQVQSQLVGLFNVSNCLAAIGVTVVALGLPPEAAQRGINIMPGVPGRMERIDLGQAFTAIVDFAHTPNALKVALETVRESIRQAPGPGRVIVVFGSAGLRDALKRRMMAEVAACLADQTIFTAEDPRTESLDGILAEMAGGAESKQGIEGQTFWRIPDRGEAIRFAVRKARTGDVVIACGKGHEQSMAFGDQEFPWDDRVAMRAALAEHLGIPGPLMPYLPTQVSS